jgi:3-hydroxyacyl-CoA dehydrogenase
MASQRKFHGAISIQIPTFEWLDKHRWARQLVRAHRPHPIAGAKGEHGFIFNRVWRAKKECLHLVDDGVAAPEDVDRAWMVVTGGSPGPFGQMGLDVVRDIKMNYWRQWGDPVRCSTQAAFRQSLRRADLAENQGKNFIVIPIQPDDSAETTTEEKIGAADTSISYGGRYSLRNDIVVHHVEVSFFPFAWEASGERPIYAGSVSDP